MPGIKERASQMNMFVRLDQKARRVWAILFLALKKFSRIDGAQWAGAFSFSAFFSLFPLVVLLVTIASSFIDRDRAGKEVVVYIERYVPMSGEMQHHIFGAIAGVINVRGQVGAAAFLILIWVSLRCFTTLVCATNRAWGTMDYNWWRLPLKSLVLLGITAGAALLGMAMPVLIRMAKEWLLPGYDLSSWLNALGAFFVPLLVVFLSLSMFYRLAPRQPKRFAEVWVAALCTTALLQAAESLFVIYVRNFATLNVVYGAFGGIMALLLWIYFSGCIFIFGACLCAARVEGRSAPA
jgi:YihY family inner membrane protein